jgi:hypothetical protein
MKEKHCQKFLHYNQTALNLETKSHLNLMGELKYSNFWTKWLHVVACLWKYRKNVPVQIQFREHDY